MGLIPFAAYTLLLLPPWILVLAELRDAHDLDIPDVTTYSGHLFSMSFRTHPFLGSEQVDDIEISLLDPSKEKFDRAAEDTLLPLPPWLYYNDTSRSLQGIPDSKDRGRILLVVMAKCRPVSECQEKQTVFQINVIDRTWNRPSEVFVRDPSLLWEHTESGQTPNVASDMNDHSECSEDKVVTSLILCSSLNDLSTSKRVELVRNLAQFLSIPDYAIDLEPSSTQNLKAVGFGFQIVSAGPGLGEDCPLVQNIELIWLLPCQVVKHLTDFVKVLQHNVDVGRFQEETGLAVVGWYIASSNSLLTRKNRRRRNVQRQGTPIPTPTIDPPSPSIVSSHMYESIATSEYSSFTPGHHTLSASETVLPSASFFDSSVQSPLESPQLSPSYVITESLPSSMGNTLSSVPPIAPVETSSESLPSDFVTVASLFTVLTSPIYPSASVPPYNPPSSLSPPSVPLGSGSPVISSLPDHQTSSTPTDSSYPQEVSIVPEEMALDSILFESPYSAIASPPLSYDFSAIRSPSDMELYSVFPSTSLGTSAIYPSSDMPFQFHSSSQQSITPSFHLLTSSSYIEDVSVIFEYPVSKQPEEYSIDQTVSGYIVHSSVPEIQSLFIMDIDSSKMYEESIDMESIAPSGYVSLSSDSISASTLDEIIPAGEPGPHILQSSGMESAGSLSLSQEDVTVSIQATPLSSVDTSRESSSARASVRPDISTVFTDDNTTDTTSAAPVTPPGQTSMKEPEEVDTTTHTTEVTTTIETNYLDTTDYPPCGWNYGDCRTPGSANSWPIVDKPIGLIIGEQGRVLELKISRDVFYDLEDGNTESLMMDLELPSGKKVPDNFWLYLVTKPPKRRGDAPLQMVKGLPLHQDMDIKNLSVVLVATDSGGLQARDSIILQINDSPRTQFTHKFTLRFAIDFQEFIHRRENIVNLMGRIASHFNDSSARFVTVLEVRKGSFILSWTNNTLSGSVCQRQAVRQLLNRMVRKDGTVRSSFNRKIGRHLELLEIRFEPLGSCIIPSTTTTVTTTVLASSRAGQGLSIWAHVILPVLIALVVFIFILFLIFICNRRRKRQEALSIIEKDAFSNERNPIIFPNEMESDDPALQPKTPLVLPSDSQLSNDSPQHHPHSQRQQQQQQPSRNYGRRHERERDKSNPKSSSSSKGRNDSQHHQGRKSKDKHKSQSRDDKVRVSISSTLSSDRPNNHYLEDDDNEGSSKSSTLRSNPSGGGSAGHSPTKRQPPPYWQAQTHHPPPYRLPPPYMNDDQSQPAPAKITEVPVAKTCTTTRV